MGVSSTFCLINIYSFIRIKALRKNGDKFCLLAIYRLLFNLTKYFMLIYVYEMKNQTLTILTIGKTLLSLFAFLTWF